VFWDFVNGLDAESRKLGHRGGVNPREPQDVIFRERRIAVVEELAGDWLAALPSSSNVRGQGHSEDTKL
jgi:hypothetical protein